MFHPNAICGHVGPYTARVTGTTGRPVKLVGLRCNLPLGHDGNHRRNTGNPRRFHEWTLTGGRVRAPSNPKGLTNGDTARV